jgi:hypothetical protein
MKRRDFMAGLGIAVALPAISRAQQTPMIGFLSTRSPDEAATSAKNAGIAAFGEFARLLVWEG